jgi:hypothetical protein
VDLTATGPLLVNAPAGLLGAFVDAWQRAIGDIGMSGAVTYLVLGPGQEADVPDGHSVIRSRTDIVHLGVRGILTPGGGTGPFVELVSSLRMYPLSRAADPTPIRIVRNCDGPFDGDWPKDAAYFDLLAEGLARVDAEPEDKVMYAMLEPLGLAPRTPPA